MNPYSQSLDLKPMQSRFLRRRWLKTAATLALLALFALVWLVVGCLYSEHV